MRNILNNFLIGLALILVVASCYPEQEVAPVDSPNDNPTVTIEPQGDYSTITEGDTLKYTITTSAFVKDNVTYAVELQESAAADATDFEVIGGVLGAYSGSTELWIVVLADDFPEEAEAFNFEISAESDMAWNWQINPASDVEVINGTIVNVNDPTLLTVAMQWVDPEHVIDFDMLIEGATLGSWGTAATADNPEISTAIWNADDDDTFYVGVDPFAVVDGDISFTFHVGHPDGSVEIFEGVFNKDNLGDYTTDQFTAWGIPMYRIATVVKTGSSYDVTFEF